MTAWTERPSPSSEREGTALVGELAARVEMTRIDEDAVCRCVADGGGGVLRDRTPRSGVNCLPSV
jgi:hypothetical protein